MIAAVTATLLSAYFSAKQRKKNRSTKQDIEELSTILENATLDVDDIEYYVPVPRIMEIKNTRELHRTIMVCGPRRVGKTTIVQKALEGEHGIIHIRLHSFTVDEFYRRILERVKFKYAEIDPSHLINNALARIKKKGGRKPIIVVDIDEKCSMDQALRLLIVMKQLGSDAKLATFFVVVSTSRASVLIPVTLAELRVDTMLINDPSEEVITSYLKKALSDLFPDIEEEETNEFIDDYVRKMGTRFLDAANLVCVLTIARRNNPEFKYAKQQGYEYINERIASYQDACSEFFQMLSNLDTEKRKEIVTSLLEGTLQLGKVSEALKVTTEQFILSVSELHPHPVYIHPKTKRLSVGNFITEQEMKTYLEI